MKTTILFSLFAVSIFVILSHSAFAATSVSGVATKCSGLATCSYSVSNSTGTGWASTSAFVGGYVGQSPLLFSGGVAYFQLPGETTVTYNGMYSGTALLAGFSSTAGTLYNVTGTITATDANDGYIVKGYTHTFIGIKGHSGRGGGIYFTLVNGTIKLIHTTQRTSSTSLSCTPISIPAGGGSTLCTATVTDPGAGNAITPTGKVTFSQSGVVGTFKPSNSCTLVLGTCSVTLTAGDNEYCSVNISSTYGGDSIHKGSKSPNAVVTITGC